MWPNKSRVRGKIQYLLLPHVHEDQNIPPSDMEFYFLERSFIFLVRSQATAKLSNLDRNEIFYNFIVVVAYSMPVYIFVSSSVLRGLIKKLLLQRRTSAVYKKIDLSRVDRLSFVAIESKKKNYIKQLSNLSRCNKFLNKFLSSFSNSVPFERSSNAIPINH